MEVKAFGPPCAYHGPYTFFNHVQIVSFASLGGSSVAHFDGQFDPKAPTQNNNITTRRKNNLRRSESLVVSEENRRTTVLRLGDCVPVRPWSDQPIACLAEIRMVWRDKGEQSLLFGLRLYFLPENTPLGRHGHGEDEVVAISDAVVIKADDLLSWLDVSLDWSWGFKVASGKSSLNLSGFTPRVSVVSFSKYCRFRALMKRMEHIESEWLRNTLIDALGGSAIDSTCSRIMFCRETFDYPELETHELLCNHLAPKLKGRPRGRRRKTASDTYHGAKYEVTSDSESAAESESSSCSSKMNFAKAKIEVQQQHLRYSQRSQRVRLKTEPSAETTTTPENDSELNEEKMKAKKENERKFLTDLHRFMVERKTPIPKMMWLSLRRVNLYDIYTRVQEFGGYETVSVNRLWKTLKKDSPGLTHSKYEKVLLPFELHQRSLQEAEEVATTCKKEKHDTVSNGQIGQIGVTSKTIKVEKMEPELSREQMTEIQNKVKAKEQKQQGKESQKMQVSVPVTVIVGSTSGSEEKTKTSQQIQIQQPRTTITVHQTTIHPQVTGSGHVTKCSSQQITNKIQITNEIKIQQITLPKGGKVGSSDSSDNGDENGGGGGGKVSALRHIRVKSNSRKFPENMPTIDLRGDSDDDDSVQTRVSAMYPPIRKRKLDILREGGLEVTPIRSKDTIQPLKQPRLNPTLDTTNVFRKVENIPKFQSKCMFTQAGKIFGNPKENVTVQRTSAPSTSLSGHGGGGEVLDLTAKKTSTDGGGGGRPAKNLTPGVAALIPSFPALANPNLMISFVPPTVMPPSLTTDTKALNFGNFLPHMLDPSRHHPAFALPPAAATTAVPPALGLPPLPPGLTIANLAELNAGMNPYLLSYMYGANGFLPPPGNLPPPFFDNSSKNKK